MSVSLVRGCPCTPQGHSLTAREAVPLLLSCHSEPSFLFFLYSAGNLLSIGSMEPVVEVWDLDLVDGVEPVIVLGQRGLGQGRGGQHKKAGKKKMSGKEEKGQVRR